MRRMLKNQKGLTMMEVLLTVALLAIVIVPCLSSFVVAQRGNVLAAQTRNEYTKAQNLMESFKADPSSLASEFPANETEVILPYSEDNIFAVCQKNSNYYTVTIYCGEYHKDTFTDTAEYILKGVIAP